MLIISNYIILLISDTFIILTCFSIFVCIWMVILFILLTLCLIRVENAYVHLDFIAAKYLDIYWFFTGIFFLTSLLIRLCLLLYFSWASTLHFDLCKVIGYQWYWVFFIFKDSVIFSNLITESDYFIGDLRLLQCNNAFQLLTFVIYKIWLTSVDVIHSFTISSLGLKVDCIPGRCNELTMLSNKSGMFYGSCSELCGVLHGFMPITIEFL